LRFVLNFGDARRQLLDQVNRPLRARRLLDAALPSRKITGRRLTGQCLTWRRLTGRRSMSRALRWLLRRQRSDLIGIQRPGERQSGLSNVVVPLIVQGSFEALDHADGRF